MLARFPADGWPLKHFLDDVMQLANEPNSQVDVQSHPPLYRQYITDSSV